VDGRRFSVDGSEVMILNCGSLGEPYLRLGRDIHLDDGRLDLFILRGRTALDYPRVAVNVLLGRERSDPSLTYLRAGSTIRIDVQGQLPVQADGDFIGHTPVEVNVVAGAVPVIVPEEDRKRTGSLGFA
jgi:diacylglycerol kinase family enzyme